MRRANNWLILTIYARIRKASKCIRGRIAILGLMRFDADFDAL